MFFCENTHQPTRLHPYFEKTESLSKRLTGYLRALNASEGWTSHTDTPTNCYPELGPQSYASLQPCVAAVGQFGGNIGSDILICGGNDTWGNELCILPGGTGAAMLESRQQMR